MFFCDDRSGNLSFDLVSESYQSARPHYPESIFTHIMTLMAQNKT